jgi:hypothetical protein
MNCPCCNQTLPPGTPIWNVIRIDLETGDRFVRDTCIQEMVATGRAAIRSRIARDNAEMSDEPIKYRFVVEETVTE